jgi:hypothetical protein
MYSTSAAHYYRHTMQGEDKHGTGYNVGRQHAQAHCAQSIQAQGRESGGHGSGTSGEEEPKQGHASQIFLSPLLQLCSRSTRRRKRSTNYLANDTGSSPLPGLWEREFWGLPGTPANLVLPASANATGGLVPVRETRDAGATGE